MLAETPSRQILLGASAACVGILLSLTFSSTLGGWLTVLATALMMYGLHRFGRGGAD